MEKKRTLGIMLILMLALVFNLPLVVAKSADPYISVPHHYQTKGYYCGHASLEMVFDFYGPDIYQYEIAGVARTNWEYGTYTDDMVRAAHFSNLSTSIGLEYFRIRGYSARKLGYAAFEHWGLTLDDLKSLIDEGYPIIVLTWFMWVGDIYGHYRVVVGYNETHVTLQDPWFGPMLYMTHPWFLSLWEYSYYWGLFISPCEVSLSIPENVRQGDTFVVTATITYPCPYPFYGGFYPASSASATITLPAGLSLIAGETPKKTLGAGNLAAGDSVTQSWTLYADASGNYTVSVEAEGMVTGYVDSHRLYPSYRYKDRIGGSADAAVTVNPISPTEALENLIQTIESWDLYGGTQNSLTSKLQDAIHLLDVGNENGAIHKLMDFMSQVEASMKKKLADADAAYLISEAQKIIDLIER